LDILVVEDPDFFGLVDVVGLDYIVDQQLVLLLRKGMVYWRVQQGAIRPQNTEQKLALTTGDAVLSAAFNFDFEH
jgi:hypothetical protein